MKESVQDIAKKINDFEAPAGGINEAAIKGLCNRAKLDASAIYGTPRYLFSKDGIGFSPLGDIQLVKAPQKNGKSFLFSLFMGVLLKGEYMGIKCNVENPKILYIDTEQHPRNTQLVYRRACKIGQIDGRENHDNFVAYHFRGYKSDEIAQSVLYLIDEVKPTAVFIDGVRDLIEDFSNIEESNYIVRALMDAALKHECAIWSILHVNPGSEKARGHLGTEFQHKASDVFSIEKEKTDEGVFFTVSQTDARNKDISDFKFVIEGVPDGDSMIAIPVPPHICEREKEEAESVVESVLKEKPGEAMYYSDLLDTVMQRSGLKKTAARKRIRTAYDAGIITRDPVFGKMRLIRNGTSNHEDEGQTLPPPPENDEPF